ncbi:MAG: hypothetical protein ACOCR0_01835, partial [Haloferacaceae archaeon]
VEDPEPERVRDRIAATDYESAAGWDVGFGESGTNERYQLSVNRWLDLDGELESVPVFRSDELEE